MFSRILMVVAAVGLIVTGQMIAGLCMAGAVGFLSIGPDLSQDKK